MPSLLSYHTPTSGILAYLPASWVPYAELMRIHKPVGTMNILFPYLYGTLFAACIKSYPEPPVTVLATVLQLFPMAFILRSAGCTWNDIIDQDKDRQVARCRFRPIARGAISPRQGYVLFAAQIILWFILVAQANSEAIPHAAVAVFLGQVYPFAKRFTDYAQVVLGVALSWGVIVGCKIGRIKPWSLIKDDPLLAIALACLWLSYLLWTVIYDTIYGFQDIQGDAKAGVKSLCLRYRHCPDALLSILSAGQVASQFAAGVAMNASMVNYLGSCIVMCLLLSAMIWKIDVANPEDCWWWFQWGSLLMGWTTTLSLVGKYSIRYLSSA